VIIPLISYYGGNLHNNHISAQKNGEETIIDRNAKGLTLSLGLNKSEAFDKALE